jgi:hypothetical protein
MQKCPVVRILGQEVEDLAGQKRISGGSADKEVNDWQVKPTAPSSSQDVTMTTPVQNWDMTLLNIWANGTSTVVNADTNPSPKRR